LQNIFADLALGKLEISQLSTSNQDIAELSDAVAKLTERNLKTAVFVSDMGLGNFSSNYEPLSESDVLGNSLLEMRKNMLSLADDEKKRNWINEGMAKFGELLRADTQDITKFSENILSNLVKYVEANQGVFYVLHNEIKGEEHLLLTACYAWGRKKFMDNKINMGEGLNSQAVLERDIIFMTDVPQEFIKISSGLGKATPGCVVIMPLMYNEEVFGTIEIASFKILEPYQVEFLKKVCVGIASSIANLKVNERTSKLLNESILQSRELQEKDSIMRQQMEEVRATQEEMERTDFQKRQIELKTNSILEGCVEAIVAFNQQGKIEFFNRTAEKIWQISKEDAIGMDISKLLPIELKKFDNTCTTMFGEGVNKKELNGKTEMTIADFKGEELSVLCSISKAMIGEECFFTAFIQNITVDIF
jgi:PAS domain S-box-containing protein